MKYQIVRLISKKIFTLLIIGTAAVLLTRCASTPKSVNDAEGLYEQGETALKDENYLTALDRFRDVKNRFPYSPKAVEAELRIADTYFAQESYIEAEAAYEIFREMHPTHRNADYVQFRIGLSFYYQIPSDTARDLTAAYRAVDAFDLIFIRYPSSKYLVDAKKYVMESRKKLAEHENYVANFYFQREHYLSSSYRYASMLKDFFGLGYDEEALYRLGVCYYHIRMFGNSRDALQRLLNDYPTTDFKGQAQALLKKLDKD